MKRAYRPGNHYWASKLTSTDLSTNYSHDYMEYFWRKMMVFGYHISSWDIQSWQSYKSNQTRSGSEISPIQGSFWAWARPMREDVTL